MNKFQFTKLLALNGSNDYEKMTHNAAIEFTDLFCQTLADALVADGKVKINDYLIFEVKEPKHFKAGVVKNPATGELTVPKNLKRLTCRAGKKMNRLIQGYDKSAPHDLSFLAAKQRSNNDFEDEDSPDDDNYDWFSDPDF